MFFNKRYKLKANSVVKEMCSVNKELDTELIKNNLNSGVYVVLKMLSHGSYINACSYTVRNIIPFLENILGCSPIYDIELSGKRCYFHLHDTDNKKQIVRIR